MCIMFLPTQSLTLSPYLPTSASVLTAPFSFAEVSFLARVRKAWGKMPRPAPSWHILDPHLVHKNTQLFNATTPRNLPYKYIHVCAKRHLLKDIQVTKDKERLITRRMMKYVTVLCWTIWNYPCLIFSASRNCNFRCFNLIALPIQYSYMYW